MAVSSYPRIYEWMKGRGYNDAEINCVVDELLEGRMERIPYTSIYAERGVFRWPFLFPSRKHTATLPL